MNEEGKPQGIGRITRSMGSIYEGSFLDGKIHGWGRGFLAGKYIIGYYQEGKFHGYGIFLDSDGTKEEGLWEDNNCEPRRLSYDKDEKFA